MIRGTIAAGALLAVLAMPKLAAAEPNLMHSPEALAEARKLAAEPPVKKTDNRIDIDHSGRKEEGKASFYGAEFDGKKMADGNTFETDKNIAASKTLPLGTVAKVTNLDNGKTATVKIEDRGPFVKGRVVDVTPKVAAKLDMKEQGVVPVVVAPVAVPQPDGAIKPGAGAVETPAAGGTPTTAATADDERAKSGK